MFSIDHESRRRHIVNNVELTAKDRMNWDGGPATYSLTPSARPEQQLLTTHLLEIRKLGEKHRIDKLVVVQTKHPVLPDF